MYMERERLNDQNVKMRSYWDYLRLIVINNAVYVPTFV